MLVITEDPVGVVNRSVTLSFTIDQASPVVSVENIVWLFNDSTILNDGLQSLLDGHVFSSDLLNLTLTNVQHSDQGFYSLVATNEAGTNSSVIFLEVEGKLQQHIHYVSLVACSVSAAPVITVPPSNRLQLEGRDVIFECEAVSEPLYSVSWQFNETLLSNSTDEYSVDENSGQLTVFRVALIDTGEYTCIVENIHGNDSASATLTVQGMLYDFIIVNNYYYNLLSNSCSTVYSRTHRHISTADRRVNKVKLFIICCSNVQYHMVQERN